MFLCLLLIITLQKTEFVWAFYLLNFVVVIRLLQFRSSKDFDHAFKAIAKKGRMYRLDKVMCLLICAKFWQIIYSLYMYFFQ